MQGDVPPVSHGVGIIGIAGPSGSGKTTLARAFADRLGDRALVLSCDGYYRDLSHLPLGSREKANFDHPDALEHQLLADHLARLRRSETIDAAPTYSFETHTRLPETATLEPKPTIVVEGLYVLYWPHVRRHLDLKVYIDASRQVCLARRIARDVHERGRTEASCRQQYERTVRPMADRFVSASRRFADLVVHGEATVAEALAGLCEAASV